MAARHDEPFGFAAAAMPEPETLYPRLAIRPATRPIRPWVVPEMCDQSYFDC